MTVSTLLPFRVIRWALLALAVAPLCWSADGLDEPAALVALTARVSEIAAKKPNFPVWIQVFGKAQKVAFVKGSADGFSFKVEGNVFDQTWSKTSKGEHVQIGKGALGADESALIPLLDYCIATGLVKEADDVIALSSKVSASLKSEMAERVKRLDALRGKPAVVSAATAGNASSPNSPAPSSSTPGKLDKAAALKEMMDLSVAGLHRRLGPDATTYKSTEKFPDVYMPNPDTIVEGKRRYQIGGPYTKDAGDYSSTQGQILYVPDSGFGCDRVSIHQMDHNCFCEKPEPPWWGGFRPEPASASWLKGAGGNPGQPIMMARGMINWANSGVAVFSSGLVGVAGTCTAKGTEPTLMLPRNKVPTAISVTNRNEFAFITVCDTETQKAQVAVIALLSSAKKTGFAHEWHEDHYGIGNVAMFTGMKLLGFVDIPGMSVPTGIIAVGNRGFTHLHRSDGNNGLPKDIDLSQQGYRDSFMKGNNTGFASSCGFAVVISRHEDKVAFIDLQPLFEKFNTMSFTTEENYQKTRDMGLEPKQWPYTFEHDPSGKPICVAVQPVPQPTAVIASLSGGKKARALVASLDGRIGIYQVGGLATEAPAVPTEIGREGEIKVGRNPCWLAYQKHTTNTFIAVSRGDRELAWVTLDEKTGPSVGRRIRDSRMIDPVHAEIADTHGIQTGIITVCDFKGRKIINYRFSDVVFATQGGARYKMGADGKAEVECGGVLEFPGSPYCVSATNVN